MKRGPKSAAEAELNVVKLASHTRPRIAAPSSLNAAERALFNDVVNHHPHLKSGDAHFLAAYAQTLAVVNKLARKTDAASAKVWDAKVRAAISMATKLRITQQAKTHHRSAGRASDNHQPVSYYDMMRNESDDD